VRYSFMIAALAFLFAASASDSTIYISVANVTADGSLPNSIRDAFEDDDGRPLRSASIDLDGDGTAEKLVPNEFLCGTGGCPWVIYSSTQRRVIGTVFGSTLAVQSSFIGGYKILIVTFSEGAKGVLTQKYAFIDGSYRKTGVN
jgi:hypothetical protein